MGVSLLTIILVAFGGACGASLRYLIAQIGFLHAAFPWATLAANLIGALIIGFIVGIVPGRLSPETTAGLKTGFCGGLTTFSTFSLEALTLFEKGRYCLATAYIITSILLCLMGVFVGRAIAIRCMNG